MGVMLRDIDGNEIFELSDDVFGKQKLFENSKVATGVVQTRSAKAKIRPDGTNLMEWAVTNKNLFNNSTKTKEYTLPNNNIILVGATFYDGGKLSTFSITFRILQQDGTYKEMKISNFWKNPLIGYYDTQLYLCVNQSYMYWYNDSIDPDLEPNYYYVGISGLTVSNNDILSSSHFTVEEYNEFWNGYNYKDDRETTDLTNATTATDNVDFPNLPAVDVVNSGFVNLYSLDISQSKQVITDMWSDSIISALNKLFSNPLDSIVNCRIIPFTPEQMGSVEPIYTGVTQLPTATGKKINSQYEVIDIGTINCGELFANFTDYSPYTSASIYLYGIGVKQLSINDIMDSKIHVKYYVDLITGNCVANIKISKNKPTPKLNSVMYSFTGNIGQTIPLSGANYNQMYTGLLQTAVGVTSGIATGNPVALTSSILSAAQALHVPIERSGGISDSTSFISSQGVYLILERPVQNNDDNVNALMGENNEYVTVNSVKGLAQFSNVHVENINYATSEELAEIENILTRGVIL